MTELFTVDRATFAVRRMGVAAWPAYDGREPFAEAFLAASNLSTPLRCAHAFAASWLESPTPIGATELFVGVPQPWRAIWLDRAAGIVVKQDMILRLGTANLATLAAAMTEFETWQIIRQEKSAAGVQLDGSLGWGPGYQGHMLPDYATVLAHGIDGFASRLAATPDGQFKACLSLMIGTWRDLLRTYAEAAQAQASVSSPDRAEELRRRHRPCSGVLLHRRPTGAGNRGFGRGLDRGHPRA